MSPARKTRLPHRVDDRDEVRVRDDAALRIPRRPRRVDEGEHVVARDGAARGLEGAGMPLQVSPPAGRKLGERKRAFPRLLERDHVR